MGRQAHLARLALGRSPFGQPIRDEGGEVFIGPHTHDNDARDYIQQFNEKGHPTLENSKLADHQLRRAQNEVYRAAGVLQAKEDIKPKSHWQRLTHRERLERIIEENAFAVSRRSIPDDFALHLSTWWICALRNRLLVSLDDVFPFSVDTNRHTSYIQNLQSYGSSKQRSICKVCRHSSVLDYPPSSQARS